MLASDAPTIVHVPKEVTALKGSDVNITCKSTAEPDPLYRFDFSSLKDQ